MMDELSGLTRRELICEVVRHRLQRDEMKRQLERIEALLAGTDAAGWAKARRLVEEATETLQSEDPEDAPSTPSLPRAGVGGALRTPMA